MLNKPQKFFESYLNNDTQELSKYLYKINDEIVKENVLNLSNEVLDKYKDLPGAATKIGINHYNIFMFPNDEIYNLYCELKNLTKKACEYYEIDFNIENYVIHGWFNFDHKSMGDKVNPVKNPEQLHDHFGGTGIPHFHGYYCVDAEPSITYYKLDKNNNDLFENVNRNNRAIISETGYPHARGDWQQNQARVTIAYDIIPFREIRNSKSMKWIPFK